MPILTGSTDGPLLSGIDLDGYPGAPFAPNIALAVGESIRSEAGWHIAPSVTETLTLEGNGGRWLILPTLYLTAVTEVRDVTDPDSPVVLGDWSAAKTPRFRAGCLRRDCGWPCTDLEVDIVHGYDSCPSDLLPAAAALAQVAKVNKGVSRVGGVQYDLSAVGDLSAIDRYRLPPRP